MKNDSHDCHGSHPEPGAAAHHASSWRHLLLDRYVLASAAVVVLLAIAYILHDHGSHLDLEFWSGFGNIVLILIALAALRGADHQPDGRLWYDLAIAYGVWAAVEIGIAFGRGLPFSTGSGVLVDLGHLIFYYLVLLVLYDLGPFDRGEIVPRTSLRLLDQLVAVPLFVGVVTYFVFIPARFDPVSYQAMVPSSLFYNMLDVIVVLMCLVRAGTLRRSTYQTFALLFGMAFLGWGTVDGLNIVYAVNNLSADWGSVADFLWFVPFIAATAANRVWTLEPGQIEARDGKPSWSLEFRVSTAILLALPLLLVAFHVVGYALHMLSPKCEVPRDITVIFVLLMVTVAIAVRWGMSRNEYRFRALVEHAPEAILIADSRTGSIVHANPKAHSLLGHATSELIGLALEDIGNPPEESEAPDSRRGDRPFRQHLEQTLEVGEPLTFEWLFERRDGGRIPCEVRISQLPGIERQVRVSILDISERKALLAETRRLSQALTQTSDLVMITDRSGIIQWVNDGFVRITGFSREEAIGATPHILNSGRHDKKFFREMWTTIVNGEVYRGVVINRRKNGTIYHDERVITPLVDEDGKIVSFIATGRDVTGRIKDQERLQYLASHDVLTGLPNRALFFERVRHALIASRRHRRRLALVFLDLDDFKTINDGLGHAVGDAVLKTVARNLRSLVRAGDTVARIGGDEFIVLSEEIIGRGDAAALAERLCSLSHTPLKIGDDELRISITGGIAIFPDDGATEEDLLRKADLAMYQAKKRQPGGYNFYSAEIAVSPKERLSISQLLPGAAARGELRLEFQPCFDLETGRATCMEALLRWENPTMGSVPPDRFIPLAESSGTIVSLGTWVLEEACRQAASWPMIAGSRPAVSVNVASRQLEVGGFMEKLTGILEKTGLPPWNLTLELTERLLVEDSAEVLRTLATFAAMGVRVAIDDFGTGYSSISYLSRFPINSIKIDRSFVTKLDEGSSVPSVIEAIIRMAHANDARVVAEGVETEVQLEVMRQLGCDLCQGFLLSRPLRADAVPAFLEDNARSGLEWVKGLTI